MPSFDKVIQRTTERLYEDERLRSNFTDAEAKIVLGWAERWIRTRVSSAKDDATATQIAQSELAHVRQPIGAMNALAAKPGTLNLAEAVAALQPPQAQSVLPRETVFKLLTAWLTTLWQTPEK